jgi:hypothetical protein
MPTGVKREQQPLLRDLIKIPERVSSGDFVVKLSEGVLQSKRVIDSYVVTTEVKQAFDEALRLIGSALAKQRSEATYLHGSFGSGKSHFMAVLHALLQGSNNARAKDGVSELLHQHEWLDDSQHKLMLVPLHLIGSESLEDGILGGYVRHIRKHHPDEPLPMVYKAQYDIRTVQKLRDALGDEQFLAQLPAPRQDAGWGKLEGSGWTAEELDRVLSKPDSLEARLLINIVVATFLPDYDRATEGQTSAFVSLDSGLQEIARHARSLNYSGLVLFLDELVLWLSGLMADETRATMEAAKVSKLVESNDASRAIPVISFIARQRNLSELATSMRTGADEQSFQDQLDYGNARFGTITLGDGNLPEIAAKRVLEPHSDETRTRLRSAFERTGNLPTAVRDVLLGSDNGAAFAKTYPFSPAFMDTLVKVSSALQRERTALKLMQIILSDRRDTLRLGQLVPLGDLFDAIADGNDSPFTQRLKSEFDKARSLYTGTLRPQMLSNAGVTEAQVAAVDNESDVQRRVDTFRGTDRLIKTLLLAALVPDVPALRGLTVSRLNALNYGEITSPVPGGEAGNAARRLQQLDSQVAELHVGDDGNDPSVHLELVGIDIQSLLDRIPGVDNTGDRRRLVKDTLLAEFGVHPDSHGAVEQKIAWRGSERVVEIVVGGVRGDVPDEAFEPSLPGRWRIVLDYPFDAGDHSPSEAAHRVQTLPGDAWTAVWIPRHITVDAGREIGRLVQIRHLLEGDRIDEVATHLGAEDRARARDLLGNHERSLEKYLRQLLRRAYGLTADTTDVQTAWDAEFVTRAPGFQPGIESGRSFADMLIQLTDRCYEYSHPKHPNLDPARKRAVVTRTQLNQVLDTVRSALDSTIGDRAEVPDKKLQETLRTIGTSLQLGDELDGAFSLNRYWLNEFQQRLNRQDVITGAHRELSVKALRATLSEEGMHEHVENLLIAAFAEFSHRTWTRAGQTIEAPEVQSITNDMVLQQRPLPTEQQWEEATRRAQLLFSGPSQPGVLSPRSVNRFARQRDTIQLYVEPTAALVSVLEAHAGNLGLDLTEPKGRYATAVAASHLVSGLAERNDPVELVRQLADHPLDVDEYVLLKSLSTAAEVAEAIRNADWSVIGQLRRLRSPQAGELLRSLHETAALDERVSSLSKALGSTKQQAVALIEKELVGDTNTPPSPVTPSRSSTSTASGDLDSIKHALDEFAQEHPGVTYRVEISVVDREAESDR